MERHVFIQKDSYHDSVLLMRISRELQGGDGISDAVVVMGTPFNRALLVDMGYAAADLEEAGPNDLVLAVSGEVVEPEELALRVADLLRADRPAEMAAGRPTNLAGALELEPRVNLVLISVPGRYAAREARRAMAHGRHVMLFSDNVSLDDEVVLKQDAAARGLLCMGPDCGTAIINGKPLAFANVVRRGSIGIVGASGTGIQEISSCIHRLGGGVSQAIGTGGRDLSAEVGGIMTVQAVRALAADPATEAIVVVSKPPAALVGATVVEVLRQAGKPAVVQFVGAAATPPNAGDSLVFAGSLAGAAVAACRMVGIEIDEDPETAPDPVALSAAIAKLGPDTRLNGLFCGGTTGQEAVALLARAGIRVHSNLHKTGGYRWDGSGKPPADHLVLDLGDDVYTAGRPHPMIEPVLRNEVLERLAEGVDGADLFLFDVVLGYGSHDDPAGLLVAGLQVARDAARSHGRELVAVASVTGTDGDPQNFAGQSRQLVDAGVIVQPNNRQAVEFTAAVLNGIRGEGGRG
ncbi:MAG: acyl-CoA synthetase FdrA [bacterium]